MLTGNASIDQIEARLIKLAALFLAFDSLALSLSNAVRLRTWQVDLRWDHWAALAIWLAGILLVHRQAARWLPGRDPYLIPICGLMVGWGVLTIWRLYPYFGMRQSLWMALSFAVLIAGLRLPAGLQFLRRYKYIWLTASLLLTALTMFFGTSPAGENFPQLWLGCCGIFLQPSEPLKLLLIVYLAAYLAGALNKSLSPSTRLLPLLAPTLVMTGLALILLLVQRDLGTAAIFLFLYAAVVYVASGCKRVLLIGGTGLVLAGILGYTLFDVVRLRVDAWINPWMDPSGRSFQIVQSLLAVANGGLVGRGPGMGSPSLVPVSHSDFIFAAIAEEHGLLGAIGLLLLIGLLANRGLKAALYAPDSYRRHLAAGLTVLLAAQSLMIIGGNLRLLPLTGVTLPFLSYGGSSLLTSFLAILLLLHISNQAAPKASAVQTAHIYTRINSIVLAGVAVAALGMGWWAIYRSSSLLARTDNPRRAIGDRYVRRGSILDRRNNPLSITTGTPGTYVRQVVYPVLSPIIGYNNPVYGQSGLEASLDPYLRGLQGYPGLAIWWNHLLYGLPPPGLDLRLSLDLSLQRTADQAMTGQRGALVLLDPQSGEILVMATRPSFDANQLDQEWARLTADPDAPLLNRATLGSYPAGSLEERLFPEGFAALGLDRTPQIRLNAADQPHAGPGTLSPLQAALAAGVLATGGVRPAPTLVLAVNTPQAGWVFLPTVDKPAQVLQASLVASRLDGITQKDASSWQFVTTISGNSGRGVTWALAGSLPSWESRPIALALVLEEINPSLAAEIAQQVLTKALQQ